MASITDIWPYRGKLEQLRRADEALRLLDIALTGEVIAVSGQGSGTAAQEPDRGADCAGPEVMRTLMNSAVLPVTTCRRYVGTALEAANRLKNGGLFSDPSGWYRALRLMHRVPVRHVRAATDAAEGVLRDGKYAEAIRTMHGAVLQDFGNGAYGAARSPAHTLNGGFSYLCNGNPAGDAVLDILVASAGLGEAVRRYGNS